MIECKSVKRKKECKNCRHIRRQKKGGVKEREKLKERDGLNAAWGMLLENYYASDITD